MTAIRCLAAAAALLGLAAAPAAPQEPTFRSATELVEVDVRIVDDNGRFVTTLGPDDFELSEEGVARPIDLVYLVTGGEARVLTAGGATPDLGAPAVQRAASRQTWIFVFDTVHLSPAGLTRTRDAVRQFIKEQFLDGDMGGIVGERGMVNNRLTSSREELDRAAASVGMPSGRRSMLLDMREWPRLRDEMETLQVARNDPEALRKAVIRACDDEPMLCQRGGGQVDTMLMEKARRLATETARTALQSMNILGALTRGLARVPGPKTVVLLSEGFVTERMESHVRTIVGQAAVAGARIYSIDARGLASGGMAEIMDARTADSTVGALGAGQDMYADGMNALAIDTGGLAIRNENNFGRALDVVARDSGTYYVLGYRPASATYDGKYRRIDVRVKRIGVRVRARRGYLALEPARLLTAIATPTTGADALPPAPAGTDDDPLSDLPAIPQPPRTLGITADVIRKVLDLARDGSTLQASGNAAAGWAAYQRGDVASAARELKAATARADARPWMHYALGFAYLAQGQPTEAARAWEQVRIAAPEFRDAYFDLADAYLQTQDSRAALSVLREAEKRWPSDADVYNAVGVVQIGRGALDDAVQTFEKAVKAAPQDSLGYFNLGRAYSMRYFRSHRYSQSMAAWISNTRDRDLAAAQFERYLTIGGPYERQAQEALAVLAWK